MNELQNFDRELITTRDGSSTVSIPAIGATYHSIHGAVQESMHVFIDAGFRYVNERLPKENELRIFEMGFGTGLNLLLTYMEAVKEGRKVYYETIEAFPLSALLVSSLNYTSALQQPGLSVFFKSIHQSEWNTIYRPIDAFAYQKVSGQLQQHLFAGQFDLVYYDAFAPGAQPELWTVDIFSLIANHLAPGGVLVTYCSKGDVRRALQAAGLMVEKIPGPPGKREMVRAIRQ
jgi:tRNA U34 5-methylaminomethyl-2-thiouridine-forming methyltransferase MnmC